MSKTELSLGQRRPSVGVLEGISQLMGFLRLDPEERSRRLMAFFVVLICVPALFGFSFYHLAYGVVTTGLAILPFAFSMAIFPFLLRSVKNARNVFRSNLALGGLMMLYLFYISAPEGHQAQWLYVYPVCAFFMLGKKEGSLFSLLLFALAALVFLCFDLFLGSVQYDVRFLGRFMVVYLMLCGCSYSYESVRTMFRKGMEMKQRELMEEKEKLSISKKAAEAANAAKSDFLANMSHELRTPLNHIIGFTELLADQRVGPANEQQKEYLEYVLQSGNHLLSIISDILDVTNLDAGKLTLEPSSVNLKLLLESSLLKIQQEAPGAGIRFTQDLDTLPHAIAADEAKLRKVVHNVLSNAVKFTPKGGSVHLAACHCEGENGMDSNLIGKMEPLSGSDGGFIMIAVSDTGIGIESEFLEKIFEPFEQVESSASRKYNGSGLGLSLTRSLVQLHGGKIWAESEGKGKGSTIRIVFPFHGA